jgi:hypothetical protein
MYSNAHDFKKTLLKQNVFTFQMKEKHTNQNKIKSLF